MIDMIIIAVFSFWFAELTKIPQRLEQRIKNSFYNDTDKEVSLKPFSCTKCLSFWIGLCYGFGLGQEWYSIIYAGLCSFIAILIFNLFYKFIKWA